jgi:hypothetical protein
MIQSLKAVDDLEGFFRDYGLIVIDECHHLPAFSFEAAVRRAPVRHFLGLTATPYRRDGLQEIVTMQCGQVRHRIASSESPAGEVKLELVVRETELAFLGTTEQPIHEVFRLLVEDERRTAFVCDDVLTAFAEGRRCLVLSQWKQHCHALAAEQLQSKGVLPLMLEGGLGKRARAALIAQIENTPAPDPLVVIATGQYLGEGFDCPQLDTPLPRLPHLLQGPRCPIHRSPHASPRGESDHPRLRLRRRQSAGTTGHARATPDHLQDARLHTRAADHPHSGRRLSRQASWPTPVPTTKKRRRSGGTVCR